MIKITAKKWFQKTYGNTYHSCLVERVTPPQPNTGFFSDNSIKYKKETIGYEPFSYGYGDHYLNTAAEILNTTESRLRSDIKNNPENYVVIAFDVNRKKDL